MMASRHGTNSSIPDPENRGTLISPVQDYRPLTDPDETRNAIEIGCTNPAPPTNSRSLSHASKGSVQDILEGRAAVNCLICRERMDSALKDEAKGSKHTPVGQHIGSITSTTSQKM